MDHGHRAIHACSWSLANGVALQLPLDTCFAHVKVVMNIDVLKVSCVLCHLEESFLADVAKPGVK